MSSYQSSSRTPLAPAGRGVTGTLVGMVAIAAVTWLLSLAVVGPLAYGTGLALTGGGRAALVLGTAGWTLSAGLPLLRPIEARFARLLFRVRRPDDAEVERIGPVWRAVCRRAGVEPSEYTLWIEDSQLVNAFALGAHFVAVTRRALELPDRPLEAVLAHELGHHRDLHPLAAVLGWWYLMPFSLLSWLLRRVRTITRALSRAFSSLRDRIRRISGERPLEGPLGLVGVLVILGGLVLVGVVLLVVLCAVWLPLWLLTGLSRALSAALSRAAEHAADRRATELGYGPGLIQVLEVFALDERRASPRGRASRLASHPSCQARIDAVRRRQTAP
ncbi:MAG TPA: M48 family metalloprotease [Actinomycetes bacterium]|jgi:STE24 endopeptidase|nr:M48 family metalloprotease [Actinomycetes bacterium]